MTKDYHKILNIEKNASKEEIKKAYYKMALRYHPDKCSDANAEEKFKEISEAYDNLYNDKVQQHNVFINPFDIFKSAFNTGFNFSFNMSNMTQGTSVIKSKQVIIQDGKVISVEKTITTHPDGTVSTEISYSN